jgi:hypothetical protein
MQLHRQRSARLEGVHHPLHGGMLAILDLHPIFRSSGTVRTIGSLGDQALEAEVTGLAEEVRTNLASLERRDEDAIRPARE